METRKNESRIENITSNEMVKKSIKRYLEVIKIKDKIRLRLCR